jgi:hypothetical protein
MAGADGMSREVRRVPLNWKHPVEPDPYWHRRVRQTSPASRLHDAGERFVGLMDDYPGRLADWQQELDLLSQRIGRCWAFHIEYHLTGYQGRDDDRPTVHPFYVWDEAGETETPVEVRDQDHLHALVMAQKKSEKPDPSDYMPVFDEHKDALGWCLYETVSEGTPVTPVFATAEELIDHLATVGQDWSQQPMRREAAEVLVRTGSSFGSMVIIGGLLYKGDEDADKIAEAAR